MRPVDTVPGSRPDTTYQQVQPGNSGNTQSSVGWGNKRFYIEENGILLLIKIELL